MDFKALGVWGLRGLNPNFLKPLEIVKTGRDFSTIEGSRSSLLFCAGPSFALLRGPCTIVSRAGFRSVERAFINRDVTLNPNP